MIDSFHILHLEDDPNDAELVRHALEAGGVSCTIKLAQGRQAFYDALDTLSFDIILADYSLPDYNGMTAFEEVQNRDLEIPFVLVTGALGEERAIESIKAGMNDYVLKTNLARLATVVPRAISEKHAEWEHGLALENLRLSQERFDLAVRGSGAGIWDWPDLRTDGIWWSPRIFEMLGYSENEFDPMTGSWSSLVYPEDVVVRAQTMKDHLEKRRPYDVEYRMRHKDGHLIWIRSRGCALWSEEGVPVRMAGYVQDVSDRKNIEEEVTELQKQLAQTQKMEAIGTLAGGIAHDFNNILAAIIGYSSLVQMRLPSGSREHEDMKKILQAGERAKYLVRQILTFARKTELEKNPVSLALIVKEVLQLLRASLPATIEIVNNIDNDVHMVLGSPTEVHQVVMNLCTNSFHAMEEHGGVLEIDLHHVDLVGHHKLGDGAYLELRVKDCGKGIDPQILDKIFDPYFTTKNIDQGTGLGLSVVQGIVQRLGGTIEVESQVGKGSCFTVWFPCYLEEVIEEKIMEILPEGGSEHIMYVDDEETLAILGQEFLEDMGYTVTPMFSSVEALAAFKTNPQKYDLVVTDHTMPKMTGVEMAIEMAKISPETPVVLCSGFKMSLDSPGVSDSSICEVLLKPEVFDKLPPVLRRLFASHS